MLEIKLREVSVKGMLLPALPYLGWYFLRRPLSFPTGMFEAVWGPAENHSVHLQARSHQGAGAGRLRPGGRHQARSVLEPGESHIMSLVLSLSLSLSLVPSLRAIALLDS